MSYEPPSPSRFAKFVVADNERECESISAFEDVPPEFLFRGKVLAFDQSLSNTGWANVSFTIDGPYVLDADNIKTEPLNGFTGHEETFIRASNIFTQVLNVLTLTKPNVIVHEAPSVRPNPRANLKDRDGAIATVMAIRCAVRSCGLPVSLHMEASQHVKKVLTGNRTAEKKRVAEAVRKLTPLHNAKERHLRLNEHTYDAMGIALVYGMENKRD